MKIGHYQFDQKIRLSMILRLNLYLDERILKILKRVNNRSKISFNKNAASELKHQPVVFWINLHTWPLLIPYYLKQTATANL